MVLDAILSVDSMLIYLFGIISSVHRESERATTSFVFPANCCHEHNAFSTRLILGVCVCVYVLFHLLAYVSMQPERDAAKGAWRCDETIFYQLIT